MRLSLDFSLKVAIEGHIFKLVVRAFQNLGAIDLMDLVSEWQTYILVLKPLVLCE